MKILLADDHILFRDALIQFIKSLCPQWVIETTENFDDALALIQDNNQYDLVMLDLRMPGMDGLNGLKTLRENFPDLNTAIISGVAEDHHVREAMSIGARAYLPKTLSGKALVKAIELVVKSDQKFIPMDETGMRIMPAYKDDYTQTTVNSPSPADDMRSDIIQKLTKREKEVLHFLSQGLSNKDIATEMGIETPTVKLHVGHVCKKLEVENRTQAAIMAHQHDLIALIRP